jgi:O-antigen/teichoic acid export membrane protein
LSRLFIAVADTMLPALSRIQDDRERAADAWLRVNRVVAGIFAPALLGLIVVAPDFVNVLLGHRWADATPLLQVLSIGVLAMGVTALGTQVLTALDRAGALLRFSIAETVLLVVGVVAGLRWGIVGVAVGYASGSVLARWWFAWLTTQALEISFSRYLRSLAGVAQACVGLTAATVSAKALLVETGAPASLRLVAVVIVGVVVYAPLCWWRVPDLRTEFARLRRDRLARRNALVDPQSPNGVSGG